MRITQRPKWKIICIAVLCLIGMLALVGGSLSVYTRNQAYQRGVARNGSSKVVQFTSNYMQACASTSGSEEYASRTVLFSEDDKKENTLTIDIYVYNYMNGSSSPANQEDITYTMKVSIADAANGEKYSIVCDNDTAVELNADNSYTYTAQDKTLIGRDSRSNKYTVTIPGSAVDRVKITATATPKNLSATNNQMLAAVIVPCTASKTAGFSVEHDFTDKTSDPKDYAGFNYLISISSGTANATLTWNSNVLEIDKYFLQKIEGTLTTSEDGQSTLTFTMNQSDGTGEYLIPIYIVDKETVEKADWTAMETYIGFTAEQSQQSSTTTS